MVERLAIEEEKKRKRAEKFGTGAAATNGTATISVRLLYRREHSIGNDHSSLDFPTFRDIMMAF